MNVIQEKNQGLLESEVLFKLRLFAIHVFFFFCFVFFFFLFVCFFFFFWFENSWFIKPPSTSISPHANTNTTIAGIQVPSYYTEIFAGQSKHFND